MGNTRFSKKMLLAYFELEKKGVDPLQMMIDVYNEAMESYKTGRGMTEKGDPGPAYLATAGNMAAKIAGFRYPTLSALAIKDMAVDAVPDRPLTSKEAVEIIKKDKFAPVEVARYDLTPVIENDSQKDPELPMGIPLKNE